MSTIENIAAAATLYSAALANLDAADAKVSKLVAALDDDANFDAAYDAIEIAVDVSGASSELAEASDVLVSAMCVLLVEQGWSAADVKTFVAKPNLDSNKRLADKFASVSL